MKSRFLVIFKHCEPLAKHKVTLKGSQSFQLIYCLAEKVIKLGRRAKTPFLMGHRRVKLLFWKFFQLHCRSRNNSCFHSLSLLLQLQMVAPVEMPFWGPIFCTHLCFCKICFIIISLVAAGKSASYIPRASLWF